MKKFKSFIKYSYQILRYGICDRDCWNLDHTLAAIILEHLKFFKKMERNGIPNEIVKNNTSEEEQVEQWNNVLEEMIWTFEYIIDPDKFNSFNESTINQNKKEIDWISYLDDKKSPEEIAEWKRYFDQSKMLEKRKQAGLKLFAKHFCDLWD